MRWLKPWLIALSILSAASAIQAQEDGVYEFAVIDILETIQQGAIEESVAALQGFLQQYPNSKLGRLLLADLYARRAGRSGPTDLSQEQSRQLAGLRSEIGHRWQRHRAPGPEAYGLIPSNLIRTAPRQDYIIAVDASRSRLYVLAKLDQRWHVIEDHYVTIGKSGMGKQKEGDLKTPLGVYFVTSYIDGATLPDRYGPGAFPINYPNAYDRGLSRTGYGIWIHGTESETFNRTPLASDGCLSLSNVGFNDIYGFVRARDHTPVIIANRIDWVEPDSLLGETAQFDRLLDNWRLAWESLDSDRILAHYDTAFRSGDASLASWFNRQPGIDGSTTHLDVSLRNISVFAYPGEDMVIISFDQETVTDGRSESRRTRQYWQNRDGRWKIIHQV